MGEYTTVMGTYTSAECVMKHEQKNIQINEEEPDIKTNDEILTIDDKLDVITEFHKNKDYDCLIRYYLNDILKLKLKDNFEYEIVTKKEDAVEKNINYLYLQRRLTFVEFICIKKIKSGIKRYDMTREKIREYYFIQAVKHLSK